MKDLAGRQAKNDETQSGCRKDLKSQDEPPQGPRHTHAPLNLSTSAIPEAWIIPTLPPFKTNSFSSCCFHDQTACFSNFIYLDRDLHLVKPNCSQWANSAPSTEQRLSSRLIFGAKSRPSEKVRPATGPATQVEKGHIPFLHSSLALPSHRKRLPEREPPIFHHLGAHQVFSFAQGKHPAPDPQGLVLGGNESVPLLSPEAEPHRGRTRSGRVAQRSWRGKL